MCAQEQQASKKEGSKQFPTKNTDVAISAQTVHKLTANWATAQTLTLNITATTREHLCLLKLIENNFTENFPPLNFLRRRTFTVFMPLLQQSTTPIEKMSADLFFTPTKPTAQTGTFKQTQALTPNSDTYISHCLFIDCSDRAIYFTAAAKLYIEKSTFTQCSTQKNQQSSRTAICYVTCVWRRSPVRLDTVVFTILMS